MKDHRKTKAQLIEELAALRKRVAALEASATDRGRTGDGLRESEERYQTLFEQSHDAIYISATDGTLLDVNQAAFDLFGYTREEMTRPKAAELYVDANDRERFQAKIEADGSVSDYVVRLRKKNGMEMECLLTSTARRGSDGEIVGYQGIVRDVTVQRLMENALRLSEERFRAVFEFSGVGAAIASPDGKVFQTNRAFQEMLGYTGDELREHTFAELTHPDDREASLQVLSDLVERRAGPISIEQRYCSKDGRILWATTTASVMRVAGGEVKYLIVMVRDITGRKRAEEALRKYEFMVSTSKDLMAFVDPTYTYRAVNAAYCGAHRKTQEETLGHTVVSVVGQKLFETTLKPNLDRCLAGERLQFEFWWDSPALGPRHVDARYDPFYDADSSVSGVVVVIRDDTDRQLSQDALRTSRERLRNLAARLHAVREEERAMVAREIHDELAQALTGLKMDLSWLMERLPGDATPLLERAHAMASLIDTTIGDVRQLSSRLRPAILDDLGLEAAIEWQAQEFASRTGVELELKLELIEVGLDRDRATAIFRILQETLTNVARHAEATCVEIRLGVKDGTVVLKVQDDGKGITEDALASTQSIGLIGMRERAGALDGRVDIHRVVAGGTAVTLRLPVGVQEPSEAQ